MSDESEKQILGLLAKEWEITGPPGIMDIRDIVSIVPLAPSDTMETLKALFARGLVDMDKLKTSAFLTPEGYDLIRNGLSEKFS